MAETLTYGYIKPETGDKAAVWWDNLADAIQLLNDHTHNGTNSAAIDIDNQKDTSTLDSGDWVAVSGKTGLYRQLVTVPSGRSYDDLYMMFQIDSGTSDGHKFTPSIEKASATTYYVYINDNSVDVLVTYL